MGYTFVGVALIIGIILYGHFEVKRFENRIKCNHKNCEYNSVGSCINESIEIKCNNFNEDDEMAGKPSCWSYRKRSG